MPPKWVNATATGGCRCPCHDGGGGEVFDILVVQASEQPTVCSTYHGRAPRVCSVPTTGAFVSEPLEHSVQRVDLDGIPTEGVVVLELLENSVLDYLWTVDLWQVY